jgi:hypothetical protein
LVCVHLLISFLGIPFAAAAAPSVLFGMKISLLGVAALALALIAPVSALVTVPLIPRKHLNVRRDRRSARRIIQRRAPTASACGSDAVLFVSLWCPFSL